MLKGKDLFRHSRTLQKRRRSYRINRWSEKPRLDVIA